MTFAKYLISYFEKLKMYLTFFNVLGRLTSFLEFITFSRKINRKKHFQNV